MHVVSSVEDMKALRKSMNGQSVGFVPTMGYLHEGHLSLIREARHDNDVVVLSIFVNPTQFLPGEDLEKYPRDFKRDENMAMQEGVDIIFYPTPDVMYPEGYNSYVVPETLGEYLCGEKRPGHFRGVMTVVLKLFNIVSPDHAYFGQKDIQQARIIEQMIEDFNLDLTMHICPISREGDGLARSSRNVYLLESHRNKADILYKSIMKADTLFQNGERSAENIKETVTEMLNTVPELKVDYVEIVDYLSLTPVREMRQRAVLALAVYFDKTRLIDNIILE